MLLRMASSLEHLESVLGYSDPGLYIPSRFYIDKELTRVIYPDFGAILRDMAGHGGSPTFVRALQFGFQLALSVDHVDRSKRVRPSTDRFELRLIAPDGSVLPAWTYEQSRKFFEAINDYQIFIANEFSDWDCVRKAREALLDLLMDARSEIPPRNLSELFFKS